MKILSLLSLLLFGQVWAQDSYYNYVPMGTYGVGFYKELMFNHQMHYHEYGYNDDAPLFIQVWHPIEKQENPKHLIFNDFRFKSLPKDLEKVYEELEKHTDTSFVEYNIEVSIPFFRSLKYKEGPYHVLETMKKTPTNSVAAKLEGKSDFPVIIYHHGAQGISDENYVLAEYFASRGYIVVSCNYHLPFEGKRFGYGEHIGYETTGPKAVIEYARTLTNNDKIGFVGHSMGAQTGFTFLHQEGWADAFVSLETTLEYFDTSFVYKNWKTLGDTMRLNADEYTLPILMFANNGRKKEIGFDFYNQISNAHVIQASAKKRFYHEAYTCIMEMRYLHRKEFRQRDSRQVKTQIKYFAKHLYFIESFLDHHLKGKSKPDLASFEEGFMVKELNPDL